MPLSNLKLTPQQELACIFNQYHDLVLLLSQLSVRQSQGLLTYLLKRPYWENLSQNEAKHILLKKLFLQLNPKSLNSGLVLAHIKQVSRTLKRAIHDGHNAEVGEILAYFKSLAKNVNLPVNRKLNKLLVEELIQVLLICRLRLNRDVEEPGDLDLFRLEESISDHLVFKATDYRPYVLQALMKRLLQSKFRKVLVYSGISLLFIYSNNCLRPKEKKQLLVFLRAAKKLVQEGSTFNQYIFLQEIKNYQLPTGPSHSFRKMLTPFLEGYDE